MEEMWVILAFLAWPLVEIGLFVAIGGQIGIWATLAWVVLSGVLGVLVLRLTAARGALKLREGLSAIRQPGAELASGAFRMLAGVLLILPGFLTDALGLLLLVPPVQALLARIVLARAVVVATSSGAARRPAQDDVIDGSWQEVPPQTPRSIGRPQGQSGWTRDEGRRP
jgi:UPF0716 protein FxsA